MPKFDNPRRRGEPGRFRGYSVHYTADRKQDLPLEDLAGTYPTLGKAKAAAQRHYATSKCSPGDVS